MTNDNKMLENIENYIKLTSKVTLLDNLCNICFNLKEKDHLTACFAYILH